MWPVDPLLLAGSAVLVLLWWWWNLAHPPADAPAQKGKTGDDRKDSQATTRYDAF
jgi:hypothetical protein